MKHPVITPAYPSTARIVLVGNGPSLLAREMGAEIDRFDEVVRFNRYRIHGFENHVGTKTTLWSTFGHGYLPGDDDVRPARVIYVYGETGEPAYAPAAIYRIPRKFYELTQQRVRNASKRSPTADVPVGMSSGCVVACWFLDVVDVPHLTLAGMDHFRKDHSGLHHYYNPKNYGRPPELDGDAEALVMLEYGQRIKYL